MSSLSTTSVHVAPEVAGLTPFVTIGTHRPVLEAVDVHLAAWVARAGHVDDFRVHLATAMASWAARHGHACADLLRLAGVVAEELADRTAEADPDTDTPPAAATTLPWPDPVDWLEALRSAPAGVVRHVDGPDATPVLGPEPLVLYGTRLYLQRYWFDECAVARSIRARAVDVPVAFDTQAVATLEALLPAVDRGEDNRQRQAAEVVLGNRLSLIVGGPGTGKTYSVARLLAVLAQQDPSMRIALAAPTGKAAARLAESIAKALAEPDVVASVSKPVRTQLAALRPTTIHRLLGSKGGQRQRFLHDATNPLPADIIVIDETSMVSLPLLARLVDAVKPDARLVLIGDPDQLESVELGAVLSDLVTAAEALESPLHGRVIRLLRAHRFGGGSPIALLADGLRRGDVDDTFVQLRAGEPSVRFIETADPLAAVAEVEAVLHPLLAQVRTAALAGQAEEALAASLQARILCAHRLGRFGVSTWNEFGERWLRGDEFGKGSWYAGRPLLITRNDARLGLANGDVGVVVAHEGALRAVFSSALGLQCIDAVQLSDIDTAYAMTVHKSQGSEYPTVVIILPPVNSPLVGRELVYTGVTRASQHLLVVGTAAAITAAVQRPATRMTGLQDALASAIAPGRADTDRRMSGSVPRPVRQ